MFHLPPWRRAAGARWATKPGGAAILSGRGGAAQGDSDAPGRCTGGMRWAEGGHYLRKTTEAMIASTSARWEPISCAWNWNSVLLWFTSQTAPGEALPDPAFGVRVKEKVRPGSSPIRRLIGCASR